MSSAEQLHPQFVVDAEGKKTAVILPVEEYEAILEDLADFAVVADRRGDATVSHQDVLKEFGADGSI